MFGDLQISPRKKRCPPVADNEETLTPKKLRMAPPTPPPTISRKGGDTDVELPHHLSRLYTVQTSLQHALSHALATCAVSPSADTGIVRNVLNHLSLTTYTGLPTHFTTDDLCRICWLWEWDGKASSIKRDDLSEEDDNPFLEKPKSSQPKDWTRGSMGIIITPATHFSKAENKRVPAYGIGIEVEMDIDKEMTGGMAAVARWTSSAEDRRGEFRKKLQKWIEIHGEASPIPNLPLADLPRLSAPVKMSSLTRVFASVSPKAASSASPAILEAPSSPTSPSKTPKKRTPHQFAVPFPATPSTRSPSPTKLTSPKKPTTTTPSKSASSLKSLLTPTKTSTPTKNYILFPQASTSGRNRQDSDVSHTPRTPRSSNVSINGESSVPSTPTHQRRSDASAEPQTPSSSRRQALYERVRQRSLSQSPRKLPSDAIKGGSLSQDQLLKMGQDEMRRRCLLGRLGGVAESIWMLFSSPPTGTNSSPFVRKRRALPMSEVSHAIIKSSPVPISAAEANESIEMLVDRCPFFLKQLSIAGEDWLEMPSNPTTPAEGSSSPTKLPSAPPSPRKSTKTDSVTELVTRSPKRVKHEGGGLREVREIIRRELELAD